MTAVFSIRPVILCGGSGTRLWPLSRKAFPKQFIPLIGEKSLLQLTLERVAPLARGQAEAITCVAAEEHRFLVADVATQAGLSVRQILEPQARNTAAAMALAALAAPTDALLLFCPADHHIPDAQAFCAMVQGAAPAAQAGRLVTFGVLPSFPSTAYGYIQKGAATGAGFEVARFVEKPAQDKALEFLASGQYLWNAGIFLMRAQALLDALQVHAPDILDVCRQAMQQPQRDGLFLRPDAQVFAGCRSQSIDYAVMERAGNVSVYPFAGVWSDVGSWNAVAQLAEPDADGNRAGGEVQHAHHLRAQDTYIHAGGQRPVVALGTRGLLVIDTPDALLVADASHAEAVKEVVAKLETLDATQAVQHRRVARPWGWYDSIDLGPRHQVKRIMVKPGASLSLQKHHHRAEHWVVVSGTAEVTNGDKVMVLSENQSTYIPIGQVHRLANPGKVPLEIIEVQSGAYLGEDDIVRFEDSYGRK
ncbi:mannose-1-phosphate guanylyltransferase/mannose-6-phosphate isomerase [Rhodoferax sp. BAB1]|uniref:mannose-1-phosphate guanylyltransferase/mannose-6-phosphate isomerase n=1 Tax=Rhodoferax sp. BAB1 TaxID=2741720 RepID=UPI00157602D2|nr:mannose-1-phosphate guanylyltransferase/mannose-6-phosphate isomerase [Rhodoferax sp. BAB1]QKO22994.1 mannose-1-phosphate guanylyltransferase/mannose-6-phosphate isomerase [Rhodoferax sp. BAB1]